MQKVEAMKILSDYPNSGAFLFYRDIGSPTGESANSLGEFIGLIKTVDTSSLEFHNQRGDFVNWVKMLGDEVLAKQIGNIQKSELKGGVLRKRLLQVLHLRHGFLRKIAEA
jgi:hypothetical protein